MSTPAIAKNAIILLKSRYKPYCFLCWHYRTQQMPPLPEFTSAPMVGATRPVPMPKAKSGIDPYSLPVPKPWGGPPSKQIYIIRFKT